MRGRGHELDGLTELPSIEDAGARRASFRQAFANLARLVADWGPSPLEGIPPQVLSRAVRVALNSGFFDDLDWISASAAGVALYELGTALPHGFEKREVGRRVLARVNEGNAEVFAAIAARMARSSRKTPFAGGLKARVALLFAAPPHAVDAGALAYVLVSRRELAKEWIASQSTGSLPARRLAARILERAAVVCARRAREGDDYAPRVFATETIAPAFARLLADREPLVWRHAAVARGLLAGVSGTHWKAMVESLHPRFTPTEWRRGAVSLVAAIATAPERALARAKDVVGSGLVTHDRGVLSTMIWGLPRALDAEPEAAEELLAAIVQADSGQAADGIAAIAREASGEAGKRAVATARRILTERTATDDDNQRVSASNLVREIEETSDRKTLRERVAYALDLFIERGARKANTAALAALEAGRTAMATLESNLPGEITVPVLRDLDLGLLEESSLGDLLVLATKDENPRAPVDELHQRLGRWLLEQERKPFERTPTSIAASSRRLRALLHLLDSLGTNPEDEHQNDVVRERRTEAARLLFGRLANDGRSPLHRTLCATLARALDGLVRDASCEPVDVLLVAAARLGDAADITTLAEASMDPDVEAALRAYARFVRRGAGEELDVAPGRVSRPFDEPPDSSIDEERQVSPIEAKIEAILELGAALADDGSGRAEGLRALYVRLARALKTIASIEARSAVEGAATAFDTLASSAQAYAQLEVGAQLRVLGESDEVPTSGVVVTQTSRLAALLLRVGDKDPAEARSSVKEAVGDLRRLLPPTFERIVSEVLTQLAELPHSAGDRTTSLHIRVEQQLPGWLGPRRTLGGFYVVRPLGSGAASSVFVAKRLEERHDEKAETFALKVPDYDGAAARSLSEKEFLEYFRAEATALLGLPPNPNLARFVTFDLAARPKPILVMELIEGPTLERFVAGAEANPQATAARAFEVLDGVLAGLEVMHRHAIGHLDLKPSNVILRDGATPTLVDFGLAGRVIRPGCATGPYGAPEVWGVLPDDFKGDPSPMAADVYAFGALAFETLTGHTLFDADNEIAIVSKHLVHDGHPQELDRLTYVRPLVELLEHTLRRDPRQRWNVKQVRQAMRAIAHHAGKFSWPLGS